MKYFAIIFIFFAFYAKVFGQNYIAISTGSWNSTSTWQGDEIPPIPYKGSIQINSGVTVYLNSDLYLEGKGNGVTLTNNGNIYSNNYGITVDKKATLINNGNIFVEFITITSQNGANLASGEFNPSSQIVVNNLTNHGEITNEGIVIVENELNNTGIITNNNDFNADIVTNTGTITGNEPIYDGDGIPLPIELLEFKAITQDNFVNIEFSTATELNNHYFEIQHSTDAIDFQNIAKIYGQGNSNQITKYKFTHNNPEIGVNYYRLKQVDFDGTINYFSIIQAYFQKSDLALISKYKENNRCFVSVKSEKTQQINLEIYNINGSLVKSDLYKLSKGENNLKLNLNNLNSSVYIFKMYSNSELISFKLNKN